MKPILSLLIGLFVAQLSVLSGADTLLKRPNILWIVVDDMSANLSCYGETLIDTPHLDALAEEGLRFTHAYATSPVCSSFRSALITGMYQTSIGVHHHRSGRGDHRIELPAGVRPIPELFREAGYWTCIGSGLREVDFRGLNVKRQRLGKTDYNFDWKPGMYDSHDWDGRAQDQPFFMQVQLHGGKLRGDSKMANLAFADRTLKELGSSTNPSKVILPPHYPDDPVFRIDWAAYLDAVRMTDAHVGKVIARLKEQGLLDNTLVVFFTDHGISAARGKQFLYDEGTHIPLVLRGPGIAPSTLREDLVSHIDVAALSLATAGIPIPKGMQGEDILAADYRSKDAVFAARDRCGETVDRIRSVRTDRFLYIRNYYPKRPLLQPNNYKDSKEIVSRLRELHAAGELTELSVSLLFAPERAEEELYLYREDRWQHTNLVSDPEHMQTLRDLRDRLNRWIDNTGDQGPESKEVYDLEIQDELRTIKPGTTRHTEFHNNAELFRRWQAEGK